MSCTLIEKGISFKQIFCGGYCCGFHEQTKLVELCLFLDPLEQNANSYILPTKLAFSLGQALIKNSQIINKDLSETEKERIIAHNLSISAVLAESVGNKRLAQEITKLLPNKETPKEEKNNYIG